MNPGNIFKFLMVLSLMPFAVTSTLKAQLFSNRNNNNNISSDQRIQSDTSRQSSKWREDKTQIYRFNIKDTLRMSLDSGIQHLHRNPLQGIWFVDLGNLGTASKSMYHQPMLNPSLQGGLNSLDAYRSDESNPVFYNTTRPYTDVYYHMASQQEQVLDLLHTQNIKPSWNISVRYRKIGSPGFYKLQRSNHDLLSVNSIYRSENQKYQATLVSNYQKFQLDENGGIVNEDFLDNPIYNDRRVLPVVAESYGSGNLSSVKNYFRRAGLRFDQIYYLGRVDSVWNDKAQKNVSSFKAYAGLRHQLYAETNYYKLTDKVPDSLFYGPLNVQNIVFGDSLKTRYAWRSWGSSLGLQAILRIREKPVSAEAGLGFEYNMYSNDWNQEGFTQPYLYAEINKNISAEMKWFYKADLKLFVAGENAGAYLLQASAGRSSDNGLNLKLGFFQQLNKPAFMFRFLQSNYFSLQQDLNPTLSTGVSALIDIPELNGQARLHFTVYNGFIYRDTTLQAKQYQQALPVWGSSFRKIFHWRNWVNENDAILQWSPQSSPIHLPLWASRHRLAYESKILKQKLKVATGLELRFHTPYFADAYSTVVFSFVSQYSQQISNWPQWTAFFNFKVKRFRATIAADQLQQIFVRNAMNYPFYPAQNFNLRFGFHWVFIN